MALNYTYLHNIIYTPHSSLTLAVVVRFLIYQSVIFLFQFPIVHKIKAKLDCMASITFTTAWTNANYSFLKLEYFHILYLCNSS